MGSVKNKDKRIMIMKSSAKERAGGRCLNDFQCFVEKRNVSSALPKEMKDQRLAISWLNLLNRVINIC